MHYIVDIIENIQVGVPELKIEHLNKLIKEAEKIRPIKISTKIMMRENFNESIRLGRFKLVMD